MKEIQDDAQTKENIPGLCIRQISIIEMTILSKAVYRFSAISMTSSQK